MNDQDKDIKSLPQWAQDLIFHLQNQVKELSAKVADLTARVDYLEGKLAKNSSNSGKPPASDGLKKPPKTKSQREKSGKKVGGQKSHEGKTLKQVANPDKVTTHSPDECTKCKANLNRVEGACIEKRQVFDLPKPEHEVTEHQLIAKTCPCCQNISKGQFPENVKGPVQYGERIKALSVYFGHKHFIPFDRLSEIFEDIFGIAVSSGTCSNIEKRLHQHLEGFESALKEHLLMARELHFDETGMRSEKKLNWVHVVSSGEATFYGMHEKRGQEAIEEFNILPRYRGYAIHDHWKPYFHYGGVKHSLCNAHHLRELKFIYEEEKEPWAEKMKKMLLQAKKESESKDLTEERILAVKAEYAKIVMEGIVHHLKLGQLEEGSNKKRAGHNLLNRLADHHECVLRFVTDKTPFTNNLAEQDIRMVKLKQKISGCFRQRKRGEMFCRIRSYISTSRKQAWNVWDALAEAVAGRPRSLQFA